MKTPNPPVSPGGPWPRVFLETQKKRAEGGGLGNREPQVFGENRWGKGGLAPGPGAPVPSCFWGNWGPGSSGAISSFWGATPSRRRSPNFPSFPGPFLVGALPQPPGPKRGGGSPFVGGGMTSSRRHRRGEPLTVRGRCILGSCRPPLGFCYPPKA